MLFRSGSTKTLAVYKDGNLIGSGSNPALGSINPTGQILRIGSYNRTSLARIETFPGRIDEVGYYSRVLSATEIAAIFNAGAVGKSKLVTTVEEVPVTVPLVGTDAENDPLTFNTVAPAPIKGTLGAITPLPLTGLVSQWAAEGNANDSADGNNGTLQNGATFAAGQVGQAFSFDGLNDFVQVADNPNLDPGTGSFSVEAWIKTSLVSAGGQYIVTQRESGQPPGIGAGVNWLGVVNGKLHGQIRDNDPGTGVQVLNGNQDVADGQFHHAVMVRDIAGGQFRLYVDGILDVSAALTEDGFIGNDDGAADPLLIGALMQSGSTNRFEIGRASCRERV